jgi:hypothetical protein
VARYFDTNQPTQHNQIIMDWIRNLVKGKGKSVSAENIVIVIVFLDISFYFVHIFRFMFQERSACMMARQKIMPCVFRTFVTTSL